MQSVSSRIWTRVAVTIFYDGNDYTTGTPAEAPDFINFFITVWEYHIHVDAASGILIYFHFFPANHKLNLDMKRLN